MHNATTAQKRYYGAANTSDGFFSLFGSIFSPEKLDRIYILKGGPGCGKSTTLKRIASRAESDGLEVERYYCSSSPSSLDGIIIPMLSTAVLDGTAPHIVEPKYPGVCENIINLGEGWDSERLYEIDEKIRELTSQKKESYETAYAYLSACSEARKVIDGCVAGYLLSDKMYRAVDRLCSKLRPIKKCGNVTPVFTDCICGSGNIHLTTLEDMSGQRYFIKDYAGIASEYFACLCDELTSRGADITVALNPLDPSKTVGIFVDDIKTSFTLYDDDYALKLDREQLPYKIVNTARFCDTRILKRQKSILKFAEKSMKTLYGGAVRHLEAASRYHDEIEGLYYGITDFGKVEEIAKELEKRIFG